MREIWGSRMGHKKTFKKSLLASWNASHPRTHPITRGKEGQPVSITAPPRLARDAFRKKANCPLFCSEKIDGGSKSTELKREAIDRVGVWRGCPRGQR